MRRLLLLAAFAAPACSSSAPDTAAAPPSAEPTAFKLNQAAKDAKSDVVPDPRSPSRVLGYVEGEVVTYRDVLLRAGPQLAMIDSPEERDRLEERVLLDILEDRLVYYAATEAKVEVTRDEIDAEREKFVKGLAQSGGTLEAFLAERGMTRREHDESIRRALVARKYLLAAIGRNQDPKVWVRAVTDTYVSPADVEKYYEDHPDRFREPATARCRMLAVEADFSVKSRRDAVAEAKAAAESAAARLRAGEDWVPVYRSARPPGSDPDPNDGYMEIQRGDDKVAQWIEDFAFSSEKGKLSDVIEKGTTFYVLKAEGAREARTVPLEECQARVRGMLVKLRQDLAGYEVELSLLDETSIRPESLHAKLRDSLRAARRKLLEQAGL